MRLLLVEDDDKIRKFIEQGLVQSGYTVDAVSNAEDGISLTNSSVYDLLILDLMLPKIDGLTFIELLRNRRNQVPVLILSAKRNVDDRIKGLQLGGDDYLTKPFSFSELLVRVQVLLRRSQLASNPSVDITTLSCGDLSLDLIRREVLRSGKMIELQTKEFNLLEYFMKNPGRVLTKNQILDHVWNFQFDPQTNVVDVLVFRLRTKIDKEFEKKFIKTIRGVGYVFQKD